FYLLSLCALFFCSCSGSNNSAQSCTSSIYDPIDSGKIPNTALSNVMSLSANAGKTGAVCDASCSNASNPAACASSSGDAGYPCLYANEPTATVTVCQHGSTTACQTFSNLLVD